MRVCEVGFEEWVAARGVPGGGGVGLEGLGLLWRGRRRAVEGVRRVAAVGVVAAALGGVVTDVAVPRVWRAGVVGCVEPLPELSRGGTFWFDLVVRVAPWAQDVVDGRGAEEAARWPVVVRPLAGGRAVAEREAVDAAARRVVGLVRAGLWWPAGYAGLVTACDLADHAVGVAAGVLAAREAEVGALARALGAVGSLSGAGVREVLEGARTGPGGLARALGVAGENGGGGVRAPVVEGCECLRGPHEFLYGSAPCEGVEVR